MSTGDPTAAACCLHDLAHVAGFGATQAQCTANAGSAFGAGPLWFNAGTALTGSVTYSGSGPSPSCKSFLQAYCPANLNHDGCVAWCAPAASGGGAPPECVAMVGARCATNMNTRVCQRACADFANGRGSGAYAGQCETAVAAYCVGSNLELDDASADPYDGSYNGGGPAPDTCKALCFGSGGFDCTPQLVAYCGSAGTSHFAADAGTVVTAPDICECYLSDAATDAFFRAKYGSLYPVVRAALDAHRACSYTPCALSPYKPLEACSTDATCYAFISAAGTRFVVDGGIDPSLSAACTTQAAGLNGSGSGSGSGTGTGSGAARPSALEAWVAVALVAAAVVLLLLLRASARVAADDQQAAISGYYQFYDVPLAGGRSLARRAQMRRRGR